MDKLKKIKPIYIEIFSLLLCDLCAINIIVDTLSYTLNQRLIYAIATLVLSLVLFYIRKNKIKYIGTFINLCTLGCLCYVIYQYGIALDENVELKDGDILYKDDKNIVVIKIKGDDVLVIKPKCMTEMGVIAHSLGNRHLQAQFEEGKMIIQYDALVESELKREKIDYSRESLKLKKAFRHVEFGHTHTNAN